MKLVAPKTRSPLRSSSGYGSVAAPWMRHVAAFLAGQGLDAPRIFTAAGLCVDDARDPDFRFPVVRVDTLWQLAALQADDPFIALRRGPAQAPSPFDVLAYAMMSCATLGDAVDRLLSYSAAVSDAVELTGERHARGITIAVRPTEPDVPGRSSRLDFTLATFLHFCNWVTGEEIRPSAVEFPYEAPASSAVHVAAFGMTPRFVRPLHALTLSSEDLSLPLPTANAQLALVHESVVEQRISGLEPNAFEQALFTAVIRAIAAGPARRPLVAKDLCMSDRTLQRRLSDHGMSFKSVVDGARKKMALKYLNDPDIPILAVGELLGFSETSTLYRASKRWFGKTPRDIRRTALARPSSRTS